MTHSVVLRPLLAEPVHRLRDLLSLLADLRQLREPLTSDSGLRSALRLLLRLAELLGVDADWIDRVQLVLDNEHVFRIVLAIVQYVSSLIDADDAATQARAEGLVVDVQSFAQWLPLVLELFTLLRRLRGV